ncbi:MAG: UDP-N-acetylmuramoyl-L-alanyl-D-glutamate--2,6-diaminopimelate ligase [Rhodothermales bacterium]|nr:UDP-N-acetylmuramoyl-L-alanyl-D-glutamate--2,6-diaminopimelate ligase [Rhodothermales bacterium]
MPTHEPIPFSRLLEPLRAAGLLVDAAGDTQTPIDALAHDSRRVEPGTCFFAISGAQADGHLFLDKAVQHGATAAVCERPPEADLPGLAAVARVTDARAALAEAAGVFFGRPSQALRLAGITGTNGKTTTAFLLHHLLQSLGETAGLIGTVEVRIGAEALTATHTTPDALELNRLLRRMADAGCTACAMEVSSHALEQERVRGQRFAAAVFTNLTHEHLDYHGTFEAYRAAKAKLFDSLGADATAVVNRDDPNWDAMVGGTSARVVTYGAASGAGPADVRFGILDNRLDGLRLRLDGAERRFRLAGTFNAYNLAAAYATARALGYAQPETLDALAEAPPVPGRLETIRAEGGPIAVVDYAHTPDALENVLRTVREMKPEGGRVLCVFGCGGDRDRQKRPVMGRIAEALADRVVLTNDNPRTEGPEQILREIQGGMERPDAAAVVTDRAAAIRQAVSESAAGDVVVVAGKGHETYQVIGRDTRHFDDREVVRQAFAARIFRRETTPDPDTRAD